MNLSQATDQDKIKALAELDGYYSLGNNHGCYGTTYAPKGWVYGENSYDKLREIDIDFHYLTSYDAIIPLIQKHDIETRRQIFRELYREKWESDTETTVRFTADIGNFVSFTPSQLADALLIATGKMTL